MLIVHWDCFTYPTPPGLGGLVRICSELGGGLVRFWKFSRVWKEFGKNLERIWSEFEKIKSLEISWSEFGQKLERNKLVRIWSEIGKNFKSLERIWKNLGRIW